MKPKQQELSKVEILMLATLGELVSKLEDILKGSRRKFNLNACEFISKDVNLLWRAPESYNQCYVKFGYENRDDLKTYISQFCERLEINDAWESLEDIEAYWNDFVLTVSKKLNLNENHEDNFIKYYFNNTKQLYNLNTNEVVSYDSIFPRLSLAVLFPLYIPGYILNNFLKELDKIKKELYVFGIDINVILFGKNKDSKIWLKQYKVNCENIFVDSSDEILKARRNLNNVFSIQSMETIGLSCKTKTHFLLPENVDWQKYLFPGGLALVSSDGTVHYEHLSSFIGDFPNSEELVEKIMFAFGELNDLTKEESVKYLKDGMKFYIAPKFDRFQYEKHSGFYYDPETTLYYEARSGYFFDGERAIYLYWCEDSKCYLPVPTAPITDSNQLAIENGMIKSDESFSYQGTSASAVYYSEINSFESQRKAIKAESSSPEKLFTESVTNDNQLFSTRKTASSHESLFHQGTSDSIINHHSELDSFETSSMNLLTEPTHTSSDNPLFSQETSASFIDHSEMDSSETGNIAAESASSMKLLAESNEMTCSSEPLSHHEMRYSEFESHVTGNNTIETESTSPGNLVTEPIETASSDKPLNSRETPASFIDHSEMDSSETDAIEGESTSSMNLFTESVTHDNNIINHHSELDSSETSSLNLLTELTHTSSDNPLNSQETSASFIDHSEMDSSETEMTCSSEPSSHQEMRYSEFESHVTGNNTIETGSSSPEKLFTESVTNDNQLSSPRKTASSHESFFHQGTSGSIINHHSELDSFVTSSMNLFTEPTHTSSDKPLISQETSASFIDHSEMDSSETGNIAAEFESSFPVNLLKESIEMNCLDESLSHETYSSLINHSQLNSSGTENIIISAESSLSVDLLTESTKATNPGDSLFHQETSISVANSSETENNVIDLESSFPVNPLKESIETASSDKLLNFQETSASFIDHSVANSSETENNVIELESSFPVNLLKESIETTSSDKLLFHQETSASVIDHSVMDSSETEINAIEAESTYPVKLLTKSVINNNQSDLETTAIKLMELEDEEPPLKKRKE